MCPRATALRSDVGFIEIDVLSRDIVNINCLGRVIMKLISIHLFILFLASTILPYWCCFHKINIYNLINTLRDACS